MLQALLVLPRKPNALHATTTTVINSQTKQLLTTRHCNLLIPSISVMLSGLRKLASAMTTGTWVPLTVYGNKVPVN